MGKGSSSDSPASAATKKKKKGRPSLLDIQKRILKQQNKKSQSHPNPNPNPSRRSSNHTSSNRRINGVSPSSDSDQDSDERAQKKQKLLLGLNLGFRFNGSDSIPNGDDHDEILINRKIGFGSDCSGASVLKVTDTSTIQGSQVESGPTTPLPDKKLLEFILDRLQKKDTHGVFSEPVDPEELPDYHDIIKHPMDFGTVRKKLNDGAYASLEQFEKDIFLICSNAMQYNGPDTVFFRQARSMQELAKKDFENLRQDSDDSEPEEPKVVRRGRPPGKGHKKLLDKTPIDRVAPEVSSDAVQDDGDNSGRSSAYNLRKAQPMYNYRSADLISTAFKAPMNSESHNSWYSDLEKEFPVSVVKAVLKYGKKLDPSEENKRDTYKLLPASGYEQSAFDIFKGDSKHLSVVGLHVQHGYARSLARFAANLGPVAWKIASRKIEAVLPHGVPFGPGWVGENDNLDHGQTEKPKPSASYEHLHEGSHQMTAGSHSFASSSSLKWGEGVDTFGRYNQQSQSVSVNRSVGDVQPVSPFQVQQIHLNHPHVSHPSEVGRIVQLMPSGSTSNEASVPPEDTRVFSRGGNGTYPMSASFINSNLAELSENSTGFQYNSFKTFLPSEALHWNLHGPVLEHKQDPMPVPPDQNVEFLVPGLLNSKHQIASSQQPDLVLQL